MLAGMTSLDARGESDSRFSPYQTSAKLRMLLLREPPRGRWATPGEPGSLCSREGWRLGAGRNGSSPGTA